jgi:carbon monoxide dehydrogenase subunit G
MAIEFDGEFRVATPREEAYRVLSDVQRFSPLLPTYQSHEICGDGTSNVNVRVGVGKIRGTAVVNLNLTEHDAPGSAKYLGKGKIMGGAFNLTAAFDLEEIAPDQTRVRWRGDLIVLGKLASLAGGLIRPVAQKQIQHLVDAIQKALDLGSPPASPESSATAQT